MAPGTTRDTPLRTFGRALLLGTKYAAEQKTEIRKSGGVLIAVAPDQALFKNEADFALIRERHVWLRPRQNACCMLELFHRDAGDILYTIERVKRQTILTLLIKESEVFLLLHLITRTPLSFWSLFFGCL